MTSSFSVEGTASVKDEMGDRLDDGALKVACDALKKMCIEDLDYPSFTAQERLELVQTAVSAYLTAATSRDQVSMGALPSPCSLSMKDGALLVAFNTDEEAERVYNLLGGPPSSLVPTAEQGVEAPLRFCDYCKSWHSKPCGNGCVWQPDMPTELPEPTPRTCTCHRDDSPPVPCAENYAFSECSALTPPIAGTGENETDIEWITTANVLCDRLGIERKADSYHIVSGISRLYSRIGVLETVLTKAKAFHDRDSGCNGFTADYEILRLEIDEALGAVLSGGQP